MAGSTQQSANAACRVPCMRRAHLSWLPAEPSSVMLPPPASLGVTRPGLAKALPAHVQELCTARREQSQQSSTQQQSRRSSVVLSTLRHQGGNGQCNPACTDLRPASAGASCSGPSRSPHRCRCRLCQKKTGGGPARGSTPLLGRPLPPRVRNAPLCHVFLRCNGRIGGMEHRFKRRGSRNDNGRRQEQRRRRRWCTGARQTCRLPDDNRNTARTPV